MGKGTEVSLREAIVPKRNKSCFFLLPLLGYAVYWYEGLLNCYLGDINNKPDLLFKRLFVHMKTYSPRLLEFKEFDQFYKLMDGSYMFVFNMPPKYMDDYHNFMEGRYSYFSEEAKRILCLLSGVKPEMNSTVYKVLYKTQDQKEKIEELVGMKLKPSEEVYSKPNLDREVYSELDIMPEENLNLERGTREVE